MAVLEAFPDAVRGSGESESANLAVDASSNRVGVFAERANLAALPAGADCIEISVWVDVGAGWELAYSVSDSGGTRDGGGFGDTHLGIVGFLPHAGNPQRRVRARLRCLRALRTRVTVAHDDQGRAVGGTEPRRSVAWDNGAPAGGNGNSSSIGSFVLGANPDKLMLAAMGTRNVPSAYSISWSLGGGEALSEVGVGTNGDRRLYCFKRVAPTAGTGTVSFTHTGAGDFFVGVYSLHGVDQTTPHGPLATGSGSGGASADCSGDMDPGGMAVGAFYDQDRSTCAVTGPGGDQTERFEIELPSGYWVAGGGATEPDSGGAMSWTGGTGGTVSVAWALPVYASAGGGGHPAARRLALASRGGHRPVEHGREGGFVMRNGVAVPVRDWMPRRKAA